MIQVEVDRWVAEGMLEEAIKCIEELRQQASKAKGFKGGHLMRRVGDSHHVESVAFWESIEDWHDWEHSETRHDINMKIAPMLDEPESVLLLEPLHVEN